jgi:hypothetical protein
MANMAVDYLELTPSAPDGDFSQSARDGAFEALPAACASMVLLLLAELGRLVASPQALSQRKT